MYSLREKESERINNMSKTPFSKKCEILGSLWFLHKEDSSQVDGWNEFFLWADVALPMSYMIWQDMIILKEDSPANPKLFIDEAWEELCKILSMNPDLEYNTLYELLP
jgi:hypothetical protein